MSAIGTEEMMHWTWQVVGLLGQGRRSRQRARPAPLGRTGRILGEVFESIRAHCNPPAARDNGLGSRCSALFLPRQF
jgi:hypothetical protein